jgi:hypothetical protein
VILALRKYGKNCLFKENEPCPALNWDYYLEQSEVAYGAWEPERRLAIGSTSSWLQWGLAFLH